MAFERVCARSEVPEDGALRVELADVDVAVVDFDGELYALQDVCSHADFPLTDGDVDEVDGAPTNLPAIKPVPVYPVRVEGDDVLVDVDAPLAVASN